MGAEQLIAGPAPVLVRGGGVRLGADLRVQPRDPAAPVEQCQGHAGTSVLMLLFGAGGNQAGLRAATCCQISVT
jgi:hypothetical protein